jgi:release factor glutamine methyltransferase
VLTSATQQLQDAGVASARLDTLILLEDCLGKDRAVLLAHPEIELTPQDVAVLREQISRRATHEPLAYIRGKVAFYGREFIVDKHVLVPRPETETMIELLKALSIATSAHIVDVGTGSGAIAITAALELPDSTITAVDVDQHCLRVARSNAERLDAAVTFMHSDLLESWTGLPITSPYIVLANLPYVPESFHINQAAAREPRLAIFGGADGLDLYRTLFKQLSGARTPPSYILTESLPVQHTDLTGIAKQYGFSLQSSKDFMQLFVPAD